MAYLSSRCMSSLRQIHSSYVVVRATPNDRKEILRMMKTIFFKTDPSSIYSKVSNIPQISPCLQEMSMESLEENSSFVAKSKETDKKIFGVAINGVRPLVLQPKYMEPIFKELRFKSEKTLLELWDFVSRMPPHPEKYVEGAENLLEIRYLVVDPACRNQGVATALVATSKKEAADKGHKFVRVDCTSHFTARIASATGMNCIYQINYRDYRSPDGEHVFTNVFFPHTKIQVFLGKSSST